MKAFKRKIKNLALYTMAEAYHIMPNREDNGTVLFPFFGRLGDMVMFLDMLLEWKRILIEEQGKKIVFACRMEVWKLLETIGYTNNLVFMELTRESLEVSYSYFQKKVRESRAHHPSEIINVRENAVIENVFIYAIPAKRKVIYRSYDMIYSNRLASKFSKKPYTDDWRPDHDMDQISCYADMIKKYGNSKYRSRISKLPSIKTDLLPEGKQYVCVCPGASAANKCWPADRYANVVDYIVDKMDIDIIFSGGKNDMMGSADIISRMKHKDRVQDLTGKTSIAEWLSVIQQAVFVLTNESGSVHIAASSHVPSVCIGEQKFSDKWLPYRPEQLRDNETIPLVVRGRKLECAFCARDSFKWSEECWECYKKHGIVKCVFEVEEEDVKRAIDLVLQLR